MKLNEVFAPIDEGKNDKHLFKAVFTAGGPGSGKSTISKKLLNHLGFKEVNIDRFIEFLSKRDGKDLKNVDLETVTKSDGLVSKSFDMYLAGRLPLVIDGTGRDYKKITDLASKLRAIGYDVGLLFVNTDLDTTIARNASRERSVDVSYLRDVWTQSQRNIGIFQDYFGNNLFIVDNNNDNVDLGPVSKRLNQFVNAPVTNAMAKKWMSEATSSGGVATVAGSAGTIRRPGEAIGAGFDPDGDKGIYE